jgi:hypothetical protein
MRAGAVSGGGHGHLDGVGAGVEEGDEQFVRDLRGVRVGGATVPIQVRTAAASTGSALNARCQVCPDSDMDIPCDR